MRKSGFAFHCHHDKLAEWCFDFNERVKYIKATKPEGEIKLHLKLFKLIPPDRIPTDLVKACKVYVKAEKVYDKAWKVYVKARKAYYEAREVCDKELTLHKDYFDKLHMELCPNCPWDGETIFSNKEG